MPTVLCGVVLMGCLVLLGGVAAAGNPLARPSNREARIHLDRGNRLYHMRSFEQAIGEYKAGALLEPATVFDFNLAQSYRQLGKYKEAIWHYERFLKYGEPEGELLDVVNTFLKEIRFQLADPAPPRLLNDPAPPRAESALASPPASQARRSGVSSSAPGIDWFGWGLAGAGVATMSAAGALLFNASRLSDQANMELDTVRWSQKHEQARYRSTVGAIIGIGGIGLTAAGVIKLVLHAGETRRTSAAVVLRITSNSASVQGCF